MTASPRSNPSGTAAAILGLNTPLTKQLERLPDLPNKKRPLWQRIIVGVLLASSLLVHTGQVLAQYQYGNGAYNPNGSYNPAPQTGYAPNGQLYLAGQPYKENQAHIDARNVANSILYNAIVKGLSEPSASNPGFVHDTLGQIDSAAAILGGAAVRSATVIYFTTTNNIYGINGGLNSPPPPSTSPTPANPNQLANYNTYKDILANAAGAGYQTVVAPPNAPGTAAVPYTNGPYLIKTANGSDAGLAAALFYNAPLSTAFEVAQSTQTPTGSSLIGGGVAANLNQDQTQVNHLAALSGGLVFASHAWLDPNNPNANNLNFTGDLGYLNRQGQVVGLNMDAANNASSSFSNDSGDASIDRQAWLRHLNQQAKTLDKREGFQIQANSLDLSGYNPTDLFRDGYDLYQYGKNQSNWQSNNDLLRRLQNGQLTPGSAEYNQASQIAQDRYRYAYATRLETNKPLKFSKEDAQRKANQLNLDGINPKELFDQGYDLFKYNPALQPNGAAENALLNRLKNGELTPGSNEYNQATQIAQERLRIAYSVALSPPPPKKTAAWKLIVGAVVGAVLTFVTAGALAPFVLSALTGATVAGASALIAGGFVAGTAIGAVTTAVAGIVAGAIGTLASTTITTGSFSQGLKAAGNSLVSGSVSAIVGAVIGVGFDFAGLSGLEGTAGTISTVAQNTLSGAVSQTLLGNGSFADNLRTSAISSVVNAASASVANTIGDAFPNQSGTNFANYAAHGVLGCASAAAKGQECAAGAIGAVAGEVAAATGALDAVAQGTIGRTLDKSETAFFGGLVGGTAAAVAGSSDNVQANFNTGTATATNAVTNNYLNHTEAAKLFALQKKFNDGTITAEESKERDAIIAKDAKTNADVQACAYSTTSACQAVKADFALAQQSYLPTQTQIQDWANKQVEGGSPYTAAQLVDAYNANFTKGQLPPNQTNSGDLNPPADWIRNQLSQSGANVLDPIYMGWATANAPAVGAGITSGIIANQAATRVGGLAGGVLGANARVGEVSKPSFVFRGDGRTPEEIFGQGFTATGTNLSVINHTTSNSNSGLISTSTSPNVAREFADMQVGGYVYTIRIPTGSVNVNQALGAKSPYPAELEVVVPGKIDAANIVGARQVDSSGKFTGPFVQNPVYKKP